METPPLEVLDQSEDSSWEANDNSSSSSSESSEISSTKDSMSMLLDPTNEASAPSAGVPSAGVPSAAALTTALTTTESIIPKLKLPVKAIPSLGTPVIPSMGNDQESVNRIATILQRVVPIPSTPEHLYEMISKSPLLLSDQRNFLHAVLPSYHYSTLKPLGHSLI